MATWTRIISEVRTRYMHHQLQATVFMNGRAKNNSLLMESAQWTPITRIFVSNMHEPSLFTHPVSFFFHEIISVNIPRMNLKRWVSSGIVYVSYSNQSNWKIVGTYLFELVQDEAIKMKCIVFHKKIRSSAYISNFSFDCLSTSLSLLSSFHFHRHTLCSSRRRYWLSVRGRHCGNWQWLSDWMHPISTLFSQFITQHLRHRVMTVWSSTLFICFLAFHSWTKRRK